ncbi:Hypothetical protein GLP15_1712 [Giardia lamblia P15]|uniref:Uncharacterized protein n=1 Tax=Giardia intestinalis (strain P15) TaxID=658858 RepID=E1EW31_GIAIA|nr:Hypothetical protein GLP15_1712 [Giardia lamblia P15]
MNVPQHVTLVVGRFIVLAVAIEQRIVILWATWDGGMTKYQLVNLGSRIEGSLIIHGYSNYLCVFCTLTHRTADRADTKLLQCAHQDFPLTQEQEGPAVSQTVEENLGAIIIDLALLICGNNWEDVCFESQLKCVDKLTSVRSVASCAEQLFLLTMQSIIQCSTVSVGSKRRLVVQSVHPHFLHDILATQKSELGSSSNLHMAVHVEELGDVLVAVYGSFLYIQRLSEGNITLYYDSTRDTKWREAFIKYKRLSILKVERFHNHELEDQKSKGPTYYYLIVGSPGVLLYMTWSAAGVAFVTLLEAYLTTRAEYTGCVRCGENLLLLNHRQQKVFCAKRVTLKNEPLHSVPAFVEAPLTLPGILTSESVIFRLDLIDFNPCSLPLSVLISHNGDGITCHCVDPAINAEPQQLHSFLPMYKSFLLHSNKDHGPVYELRASPHLERNADQLVAISFSRYHLFRRLEFYWDASLDRPFCSVFPAVVNYYKKGEQLVEQRLRLPILPLNMTGVTQMSRNSVEDLYAKLRARLLASAYIYGDYLMTIHTSNEAHEFAGPLLRRWLYSHPSFEFGPLFAAAYYLLITNLRTCDQCWLPLPFHLPHLKFEIASMHIAESDYTGKRMPELSMIVYSLTMHSESVLLCRCTFKEGRASLVSSNLNNLLLSVTDLTDVAIRRAPGLQFQVIHAGSNSSYAFIAPDCCVVELYHDLADGGASYEEIKPLQHRIHGVIYKQLCAALVCQLCGDYERTLTPAEQSSCGEQDIGKSMRSTRPYLTIGGNPNPRISILNGMHGRRFYCIVFIGERKMFGLSIPSLSVDKSLTTKRFPEEELKWYQLMSRLDDETPLALGLILLSQSSKKVARVYKFPILACLQRSVLSLDRDVSIYDYLDAITIPLARGEAYIGLVNLSAANTMSDWILVCILDKHICVYSVPLGTILALERVDEQAGPVRGVQGFAWLDGAAIYIHGQHSSQLVTLMQMHRTINGV